MQVQMSNDNQHTINELNNIIYLCIKYTFKNVHKDLANPKNTDIKTILSTLSNEPSETEIIDKIIDFVRKTYIDDVDSNRELYTHYMKYVISRFKKQPFRLRNDLGKDTEADEFIVLH